MSILSDFHAISEYLKSLSEASRGQYGVGGKGRKRETGGPEPVLITGRRSKRIDQLVEQARNLDIPVRTADDGELSRLTGGREHHGVLLQLPHGVERATDIDSFLSSTLPDTAMVIALDGITDPHNLGAVLRSADQFGADLMLLPGRRSAQVNETVARVSAGAAAHVAVANVTNLTRALQTLQSDGGFWVYGADVDGRSIIELDFTGRSVFVLGSEGKGMSRLVRETCDETVRIPSFGHVDSLNVSVAAAILMYELRRRQGYLSG